MAHQELPHLKLPEGITSRQIDLSSFGHLSFHVLEAGSPSNPLILLLHGFPMLAYSWRRIMLPLANSGYYVVAPDQRGYGRTTGWDTRTYTEVDLHAFSTTIFVRDALALVSAMGFEKVKCVVGIDAGGVTAGACAIMRPDIFESVMLLTHPFNGSPKLPFNISNDLKNEGLVQNNIATNKTGSTSIHEQLAALGRKHYKWYYSTPEANADMTIPSTKGGLSAFLRGYFYVKSASWAGNKPHPLQGGWIASELVKLPYYYIMPLNSTMPEAIEELMVHESKEEIELSKEWLSDEDIEVYTSEYSRTTFAGGLNWYRAYTDGKFKQGMDVFAGLKIKIPCAFIAGDKDWGTYQEPGTIEKMRDGTFCEDFRFFKIVEGAGHWIPQEKPDEVVEGILNLVNGVK
ncbi:putative epoxide hydrolase [Talaromyces proteolyticus]|uniref:Epoxide hydrolase n=1 Tax=Talaromyces proteolyticus TaxID=1131652 RepID=A0AAD4KX82_9EURO|nr:putative epoxide hydrolase [Talaromyces proteolyticus]KAH8703210.1 putative epoxide hydrolase [Talaromyces proteolyticus]